MPIDPRQVSDFAMLTDDQLELTLVLGGVLSDLDEGTSREAARLLRTATRERARTNARARLDRAARHLEDAQEPLRTLALTSHHQALLDTTRTLAGVALTLRRAANALQTRDLAHVVTDRTLPIVPSESELRTALEGMAGAFAIANSEPDTAFALVLPLYRDLGAAVVGLDAPDLADLEDQWRTLALLLVARTARGGYETLGSGIAEPYAHDTRLYLASLMAARANQLGVRKKLGGPA